MLKFKLEFFSLTRKTGQRLTYSPDQCNNLMELAFTQNLNGWMDACNFTPFLIVFQSYLDDGRMTMRGCVPCNNIYGWKGFSLQRVSTNRLVDQQALNLHNEIPWFPQNFETKCQWVNRPTVQTGDNYIPLTSLNP